MLRLSSFATFTALSLFGATAFADEPEPEPLPPPNIVVEPPAADTRPRAHIKVTTTETVFLQHMNADNSWTDVCTAPCEADVTQGDRYRITGGAGITREVVVDRPYVEIAVDPPNKTVRVLGITGIVVGGVTALVGFVELMLGLEHASFDCTYPQRSFATPEEAAAWLLGQLTVPPGRSIAP